MNFVLQIHAGIPTFAVVDKSSQVIEQLDGELFVLVLLVAGDIVLNSDFQRVGQDGPCDATLVVRQCIQIVSMVGIGQELNEFFATLFVLGDCFVEEKGVVNLQLCQSGRQSHAATVLV